MADQSRNARLLSEAISKLNAADHPCLIYETNAEKVAVVAQFVNVGFERGERCLILTPERDIAAFLAELASAGIASTEALAGGALVIPDIHLIYAPDEALVAERVIAFLDRAVSEAKADGYTGLRLIGNMSWTLEGASGPEQLIEYEAKLNDFIHSHDLPALCLYDENLYRPAVLLDVMRTHPKVIMRHVVCSNSFYLSPEEFFRAERAASEVKSYLQGMLSNEELIHSLQERLSLLNAVIDNTADAVYVKDLQGRYLMMSPAGAAFFGKQVDEVVGRTASDLLAPEYAEQINKADQEALASAVPIKNEITIKSTGGERTLLALKRSYKNARGEVVGIIGISRDISEQHRLELEIADYQDQLRYMVSQVSRVEERERYKIAAALHDQIGQTLALAKIRLDTLAADEDFSKNIKQVGDLIDVAIQNTRSLTSELSPLILYEFGFEAAVQTLCKEFRNRHHLNIVWKDDKTTKPLDVELRLLLYRSVRELLVNIIKHAQARNVKVTTQKDGDYIRILVEDDGSGFTWGKKDIRAGKDVGFGLFSIRENLHYAGGCFDLDSAPGRGTRVTLVAPLSKNQR